MAIYRNIHINYWQDGFVLDLTPEEKYFYIYLMTNSKTSQCGIYELPKRIIETETGYNRETVEKLIKRFVEYKKIVYCDVTKEVFIKNWTKHNKIISPKVKKCVEKELKTVKSKELISLFLEECNRFGYSIDINDLHTYADDENKVIDLCGGSDDKNLDKDSVHSIGKYKLLYEQNVGLINGVTSQWLIEISESIEYELFKRAIEIATDRGKCNKGYINGILKQWKENNICSLRDYEAYEVSVKNKGDSYGRYKCEYSKSKYARESEEENEELYRKPTEEELRAVEKMYGVR